jgi:hypothetical protein
VAAAQKDGDRDGPGGLCHAVRPPVIP